MAGVAGLEPVTSAVTGQRSNQLSYTPASGEQNGRKINSARQRGIVTKAIRAADAKEVGVGNPAEETYRYPNRFQVTTPATFVNTLSFALSFARHFACPPERVIGFQPDGHRIFQPVRSRVWRLHEAWRRPNHGYTPSRQ